MTTSEGVKTPTGLIRLKLPDSAKTAKWYEEIESYYLPPQGRLYTSEYEELKGLYEFFNNDISSYEEQINAMCNDLVGLGVAAQEELLPYNKMRNKFEVLSGDLLRRANNHKVVLLTAKAVYRKDEALKEAIKASVEQDLALVISNVIDTLEALPEKELQQFIEDKRAQLTPRDINYKKFLSEKEIVKSKLLKWTMLEQNVKHKKVTSFKDVFIGNRMFIYNGWKHGKPYFELRNPLFCGWHKSPNIPFVDKGDYFWYQDSITIGTALDEYVNKLSDKEIADLMRHTNYFNNLSEDHLHKFVYDHTQYYATMERVEPRNFIEQSDVGMFQGDSTTHPARAEKIKRVHLEFKAYKEVLFYTYTDEYNEPITVMLEKNTNIIPETAERVSYTNEWMEKDIKYIWTDEFGSYHEVVIKWIPRRYELTRLGDNLIVDAREVPFQPDNIDAPHSKFGLSTKGGIVSSTNATSLSLMQNGMPYQMQIFAAKALQNREMAKYRGFEIHQDVDQIPEDLALDNDGNPMSFEDAVFRNETIARKTGSRFYSSGRTKGNMPPPSTRGAGVNVVQLGNAGEFIHLQNFINMLDLELGMAVGVPPQREGQLVPNTNVTDNQQSLMQTMLQTELYYMWHNMVWNQVLNEHLINLDTYFKLWFEENPNSKEHLLEYIAPDGAKELIRITPDTLDHENIGLFITDSSSDKLYMDYMLANIHPVFQNAGEGAEAMSSILKAISSGASKEEVHKMILEESDRQRKRMEERYKMEQETLAQAKAEERDLEKYKSDLKIEEAIAREIERRKTEIERAEISATTFALQKDIDKNQVNDDIQKEKLKQEEETKRLKLKLASEEKQAALKITST